MAELFPSLQSNPAEAPRDALVRLQTRLAEIDQQLQPPYTPTGMERLELQTERANLEVRIAEVERLTRIDDWRERMGPVADRQTDRNLDPFWEEINASLETLRTEITLTPEEEATLRTEIRARARTAQEQAGVFVAPPDEEAAGEDEEAEGVTEDAAQEEAVGDTEAEEEESVGEDADAEGAGENTNEEGAAEDATELEEATGEAEDGEATTAADEGEAAGEEDDAEGVGDIPERERANAFIEAEGNAIIQFLSQAMRREGFSYRTNRDGVERFIRDFCQNRPGMQLDDAQQEQVVSIIMGLLEDARTISPTDVTVASVQGGSQARPPRTEDAPANDERNVRRTAWLRVYREWIRNDIVNNFVSMARGGTFDGITLPPRDTFGESAESIRQGLRQYSPDSFANTFHEAMDRHIIQNNHFTPEEVDLIRRGVLKHFYIQSRDALREAENPANQPPAPTAGVRGWLQGLLPAQNQANNNIQTARELYDRNRSEYIVGELEQVIAAKTAQTDQAFNSRQPMQWLGRWYGRLGEMNLERLGERMGLLNDSPEHKAQMGRWGKAGRFILKMASVRTLLMAGLAGLTGPLGVRAMASAGAGLLAA